jgi:hypothetical protein
MQSATRSRHIAWATLVAMLFSAVSPGIAATLLSDQPAALAHLLGIPTPSHEPALADRSAHSAHHSAHSAPESHDRPAHKGHDIYCSLCLNATSTVALSMSPASLCVLVVEVRARPTQSQNVLTAAFRPLYRSRAPPSFS